MPNPLVTGTKAVTDASEALDSARMRLLLSFIKLPAIEASFFFPNAAAFDTPALANFGRDASVVLRCFSLAVAVEGAPVLAFEVLEALYALEIPPTVLTLFTRFTFARPGK